MRQQRITVFSCAHKKEHSRVCAMEMYAAMHNNSPHASHSPRKYIQEATVHTTPPPAPPTNKSEHQHERKADERAYCRCRKGTYKRTISNFQLSTTRQHARHHHHRNSNVRNQQQHQQQRTTTLEYDGSTVQCKPTPFEKRICSVQLTSAPTMMQMRVFLNYATIHHVPPNCIEQATAKTSSSSMQARSKPLDQS